MSTIRGVLLAGQFRTHRELSKMPNEEQRNTLITELGSRLFQSGGALSQSPTKRLQSYDDATLVGIGASLVFVRKGGIRTDKQLKSMSDDDVRNTLIVEIDAQTREGKGLQAWGNLDLVLRGLGHAPFGVTLKASTYIRGVLLAGGFRTHAQLNKMSAEEMRNTLIVELQKHSNQKDYQSFDDYRLGEAGAAMVFLREAGIRDDVTLKAMSFEDQRNTLIVEIESQTGLGEPALQALSNIDLIRLGLGVDPNEVIRPVLRPLEPATTWLQFRLRKFNEHESTDDLLQGGNDEVFLSAQGWDSATLRVGTDGQPAADMLRVAPIGDVSDDNVRGPWAQEPHVLLEFPLFQTVPGPRTFVVTLLIVEHDNEDVGMVFDELYKVVGKKAKEAVQEGAKSVGAAVGTAIVPGVGTVVMGMAAGYLAGVAWDEVMDSIRSGLANEVFTPIILAMSLDEHNTNSSSNLGRPLIYRVDEHGASYDIEYDWFMKADNY